MKSRSARFPSQQPCHPIALTIGQDFELGERFPQLAWRGTESTRRPADLTQAGDGNETTGSHALDQLLVEPWLSEHMANNQVDRWARR